MPHAGVAVQVRESATAELAEIEAGRAELMANLTAAREERDAIVSEVEVRRLGAQWERTRWDGTGGDFSFVRTLF